MQTKTRKQKTLMNKLTSGTGICMVRIGCWYFIPSLQRRLYREDSLSLSLIMRIKWRYDDVVGPWSRVKVRVLALLWMNFRKEDTMQLKNKLLQDPCGMTPEKRSACQSLTWTCCEVVFEKSPLASWVSVETVHLVNFHSCAGLAKHCHQEPWGFLYFYTVFLSPPHSELSPLKMYALWAYLCCCLVFFYLLLWQKHLFGCFRYKQVGFLVL